ncbi:hypothetical protein ACG1BZ_14125 [Microbulbifer sp. CNSA002]|uniref:hypothetical protein n=1 Tax=Microbulbifer sp. CNSA002 TaxID=3373604 RepID=UPI0039B5AFEE
MYNLSEIFALDLAAYAVMSNHYHVVLYIDKKSADKLEVIDRRQKIFTTSNLAQRYLNGDALDPCKLKALKTSLRYGDNA